MLENTFLWRLAYVLPNMVAAAFMVYVAVLAWRYRARRGGFALWVFSVGAIIWAFFEGVNYIGLSQEQIYFSWHLENIGVSIAPLLKSFIMSRKRL